MSRVFASTRTRVSIAVVMLLVLASVGAYVYLNRQPAGASTSVTLTVFTGTVQLQHNGGAFTNATSGTQLALGDTVRTGATAKAAITFADKSVTRLDSNTTVSITDASKVGTGYHTSLAQSAGKTWSNVVRLVGGGSFKVTGPNNSTAEVRGTKFAYIIENGSQRVDDFSGVVDFSSHNQTAHLTTGLFSSVPPGGTPTPPAPIPTADQNDAFTVFNVAADSNQEGTGGNVTGVSADNTIAVGQTTPVEPGATADGNTDLNYTLDWEGSTFELILVDPDGNDFESQASDSHPFTITLAKPRAGNWGYKVHDVKSEKPNEHWSLVISAVNPSKLTPQPFFVGADATSCDHTVVAGQTDSWTVRARDAAGTPTLTVPALPGYATVTPGDGSLTFGWAPPASLASSSDLGFSVTATLGDGVATIECTEHVRALPRSSTISGHVTSAGSGVGGVTTTLTLPDGTNQTTATAGDGSYSFGSLGSGTYTVAITVPSGYTADGPTGRSETVDGLDSATADFSLAAVPAAPPPPPAPPAISGLNPAAGPVTGGTTVIITGSGLTAATSVSFGGTAATSFIVNSDSQVTATSPAHATGPVDVTVTTPVGTSPVVAADKFDFRPLLNDVDPDVTPATGGILTHVYGNGFTGASTVTVGGASVPFTVVSDTEITFRSPSHAASTQDVVVTIGGDVTATTPSDRLTFQAPTAECGTTIATGQTVTWTTGVYSLTCNATVNGTLNLNVTGGDILVLGSAAGLYVSDGLLQTVGDDATHRVTFTSASSNPAPGDWQGLNVSDPSLTGSTLTLSNSSIEYAATGVNASYGATVNLASDRVEHSQYNGLYLYEANYTVTGSQVNGTASGDGVDLWTYYTTATFTGNTITGAALYGLWMSDGTCGCGAPRVSASARAHAQPANHQHAAAPAPRAKAPAARSGGSRHAAPRPHVAHTAPAPPARRAIAAPRLPALPHAGPRAENRPAITRYSRTAIAATPPITIQGNVLNGNGLVGDGTYTYSAAYFSVAPGRFGSLTGNTGYGNGVDDIELTGTFSENVTWVPAKVNSASTDLLGYLPASDNTLQFNSSHLTIPAGTVIKSYYGNIEFNGGGITIGDSSAGGAVITSGSDTSAGPNVCNTSVLFTQLTCGDPTQTYGLEIDLWSDATSGATFTSAGTAASPTVLEYNYGVSGDGNGNVAVSNSKFLHIFEPFYLYGFAGTESLTVDAATFLDNSDYSIDAEWIGPVTISNSSFQDSDGPLYADVDGNVSVSNSTFKTVDTANFSPDMLEVWQYTTAPTPPTLTVSNVTFDTGDEGVDTDFATNVSGSTFKNLAFDGIYTDSTGALNVSGSTFDHILYDEGIYSATAPATVSTSSFTNIGDPNNYAYGIETGGDLTATNDTFDTVGGEGIYTFGGVTSVTGGSMKNFGAGSNYSYGLDAEGTGGSLTNMVFDNLYGEAVYDFPGTTDTFTMSGGSISNLVNGSYGFDDECGIGNISNVTFTNIDGTALYEYSCGTAGEALNASNVTVSNVTSQGGWAYGVEGYCCGAINLTNVDVIGVSGNGEGIFADSGNPLTISGGEVIGAAPNANNTSDFYAGVEAVGTASISGFKVDRLGADATHPWIAGLILQGASTVGTTLISNVPGYGIYLTGPSLTFDHSALHDDGNATQQYAGVYVAYQGAAFTNSNIYSNAYYDFSLWANATATGDWWGGGKPTVTGPGQLADSADASGPVSGAPAAPRYVPAPAAGTSAPTVPAGATPTPTTSSSTTTPSATAAPAPAPAPTASPAPTATPAAATPTPAPTAPAPLPTTSAATPTPAPTPAATLP